MAIRDSRGYATLLRVRKRQEDLKAGALAEAQRSVHRAEAERAEVLAYQQRIVYGAERASKSLENVSSVRQYLLFERHLARRAVDKDSEVAALKNVADDRRQELETSMKERRMVERLLERAHEERARRRAELEQKASDEMASIRAALATSRRGEVLPGMAET